MSTQTQTHNSKLSDAELCRTNGWTPGVRLVGDEGHGPTVIELTAVGESGILAKCVSQNGDTSRGWGEGSWTLHHREWKQLGLDVIPEHEEAVCSDSSDRLCEECISCSDPA